MSAIADINTSSAHVGYSRHAVGLHLNLQHGNSPRLSYRHDEETREPQQHLAIEAGGVGLRDPRLPGRLACWRARPHVHSCRQARVSRRARPDGMTRSSSARDPFGLDLSPKPEENSAVAGGREDSGVVRPDTEQAFDIGRSVLS